MTRKTHLQVIAGLLAALTLSTSAFATTPAQAVQAGADRVAEVQHTDGKWGWPLVAPPTYSNVVGPIGLGQIDAYKLTNDADHLASATAAGDALVGLTADWVGSYNPLFLVELSQLTGNNAYLNQAQNFFSQLDAGTYMRKGTPTDTAGFISAVQAGRSGTWVNLLPWDLAPLAAAAEVAGTTAQKDAFVQAMKDGIDTLDSSSPSSVYSDTLGLAGGVLGLNWLNEDHDPTTGSFATANSVDDMANMLAALQNANGSWSGHSTITNPSAGDEDLQITAYAVLALDTANDAGQYDDEIISAHHYLTSMQNVDGGWPSYPGGAEYAEVDAEVVWALAATADVPEPATLSVMALMGLATLRRRYRSM